MFIVIFLAKIQLMQIMIVLVHVLSVIPESTSSIFVPVAETLVSVRSNFFFSPHLFAITFRGVPVSTKFIQVLISYSIDSVRFRKFQYYSCLRIIFKFVYFISEIGIDTNLAALQEGHLVTVLLATLRQDAHQKHDSHNRKRIFLATIMSLLSMSVVYSSNLL